MVIADRHVVDHQAYELLPLGKDEFLQARPDVPRERRQALVEKGIGHQLGLTS
jgi:hypothetical protein